jgi:hypothetical protein
MVFGTEKSLAFGLLGLLAGFCAMTFGLGSSGMGSDSGCAGVGTGSTTGAVFLGARLTSKAVLYSAVFKLVLGTINIKTSACKIIETNKASSVLRLM